VAIQGRLPPMDGERFLKHIEANFAANYLTVLGIAQNVVLGILILRTAQALSEPARVGSAGAAFTWMAAGLTFLIVVLVWYSYQWSTYLDRWVPGLPDSAIPFMLAASQGLLAVSVDSPSVFFWGLFATGLVGVLAYLHTLSRIASADFNPPEVYTYHRQHNRGSLLVALLGSAYAFVVNVWLTPSKWWLVPVIVIVIALIAISSRQWNKILIYLTGVEGKAAGPRD